MKGVRAFSVLAIVGLAGAWLAIESSARADRPDRTTPTPTTIPHRLVMSCPEGYVRVPAGTFTMGSPDGEGLPAEHPQRRITLAAFCMQKTEVTNDAYAACVAAGACTAAGSEVKWPNITEADRAKVSSFCNAGKEDRGNHPVTCVDWFQADAYCKWTGAKLPTEEQWEYAARGADGRTYPWGNETPSEKLLNACGAECEASFRAKTGDPTPWRPAYPGDDGWPETAPVGSFPSGASPFGALDMAGNVVEWTASPFCSEGNCTPNMRYFKGSAWSTHDSTPSLLRSARRKHLDATIRLFDLGFRCAR